MKTGRFQPKATVAEETAKEAGDGEEIGVGRKSEESDEEVGRSF
jgi:hypothetical protein